MSIWGKEETVWTMTASGCTGIEPAIRWYAESFGMKVLDRPKEDRAAMLYPHGGERLGVPHDGNSLAVCDFVHVGQELILGARINSLRLSRNKRLPPLTGWRPFVVGEISHV